MELAAVHTAEEHDASTWHTGRGAGGYKNKYSIHILQYKIRANMQYVTLQSVVTRRHPPKVSAIPSSTASNIELYRQTDRPRHNQKDYPPAGIAQNQQSEGVLSNAYCTVVATVQRAGQ